MIEFVFGEAVFIETFGKHYLGRVKSVGYTTVTLEQASWVANSGRFGEFIRTGRSINTESEFIGETTIPLMYISAKTAWPHALPTTDQ